MAALGEKLANRVSVEILGERYTIRGDAEPGYIAEVGRIVDGRMRELRGQAREMSKTRLAVLVAINLADELLQEKNRPSSPENDEVLMRTRSLISLLDEGLSGDSFEPIRRDA